MAKRLRPLDRALVDIVHRECSGELRRFKQLEHLRAIVFGGFGLFEMGLRLQPTYR